MLMDEVTTYVLTKICIVWTLLSIQRNKRWSPWQEQEPDCGESQIASTYIFVSHTSRMFCGWPVRRRIRFVKPLTNRYNHTATRRRVFGERSLNALQHHEQWRGYPHDGCWLSISNFERKREGSEYQSPGHGKLAMVASVMCILECN